MKSLFLIRGLLFWTQLSASTLAEEAKAPATPVTRDAAKPSDVFTLIVLPDTQGYADTRYRETRKHWPDIGDQHACFFRQTEWIKNNRRKRNIALVVHVGDITQTGHDDEWTIANAAFKTIDIRRDRCRDAQ